jgi:2-polyprenyl-3-methyl-5-hydroxy-6-metoxy-1,4-benzoquinol methylase
MDSEQPDPIAKLRILVVIASYGATNDQYLLRIVREYRSMPFEVKIVILSNIKKMVDPYIEIKVGLPDKNPWSLPFAHKRVFAEHIDQYDLFLYSEDDILIKENNIRSFVAISSQLEPREIAGLFRVEYDSSNRKYFCDVHDIFHWDPDSVVTRGDYTLAYFSNEHAGCYILTNEQLRMAINSGGFLVGPHQWKYDLLCTAATDAYTQCGLIKLIAISHFSDVCVEHLSHKYIGTLSIGDEELQPQIEFLLKIRKDKQRSNQLIPNSTKLMANRYSKNYYEPRNDEMVTLLDNNRYKIMAIGTGSGETERLLSEFGHEVTALPLDAVICSKIRSDPIKIIDGGILEACARLSSESFDYVIIHDILHLMPGPAEFLAAICTATKQETTLIVNWTNTNSIRNFYTDITQFKFALNLPKFELSGVHSLSKRKFEDWCKTANLNITRTLPIQPKKGRGYGLLEWISPSKLISVAQKGKSQPG